MNKALVKEIKNWIRDFEATQPKNVIIDTEDQSFEGSAYWILKQVLEEAKKIDFALNPYKYKK